MSTKTKIWISIVAILFVLGAIGNCNKHFSKDKTTRTQPKTSSNDQHDSPSVAITQAVDTSSWKYYNHEDRMTSAITYYAADLYSDERITTGGYWRDRATSTTTTKTTIKEKKPWFQTKRTINRKKFDATTTTTTTNNSSPEWVSNTGYLFLHLKYNVKKNTTVEILSSTGSLDVNFKTVRIRFDNNEPVRFNVTPNTTDKSQANGFYINSPKEIITMLKKSNKMLVEIGSEGSELASIFTFQVAGLEWNY
ncbi:hypothetical protein SAMN05428988_5300 [Chitinophaga sp. YR573]|uniref:hypothetical protein n=1 Tax=Chitinophaga sp. YR573 TaxID=1881040 RepID=UPI0008AB33FA|nr:hypothetical protein [Chitinophaga sp. YR573]SEW40429.1 hypothetical protein SAMN05428988_5300 [Chitinophaga sp. YR573]